MHKRPKRNLFQGKEVGSFMTMTQLPSFPRRTKQPTNGFEYSIEQTYHLSTQVSIQTGMTKLYSNYQASVTFNHVWNQGSRAIGGHDDLGYVSFFPLQQCFYNSITTIGFNCGRNLIFIGQQKLETESNEWSQNQNFQGTSYFADRTSTTRSNLWMLKP